MNQTKRRDIQYLRGFSVLLVIIFHSRSSILPNGYLGVDIFFCISGFVLAPRIKILYENKSKREAVNFLKRRWNRLMPAFIIATFFNLIILLFFASFNELKIIFAQALLSSVFIGNLSAYRLIGDYFHPNPNPFLHYWSLSCEWQIYFIVPIIIIIAARYIKFELLFLFLTLLSVISNFVSPISTSINYYLPINRIWEFCVGIFLYFLLSKSNKYLRFKYLSRLILTLLLLSILFLRIDETFLSILLAVLIFVLFLLSSIDGSNVILRQFEWVGNRSYSAYLYHLPFIYIAIYSPTSASNQSFRLIGVLVAFILTFIFSELSFKYLENKSVSYNLSFNSMLYKYATQVIVPILLINTLLVYASPRNLNRVDVAWDKSKKCLNASGVCLLKRNGISNIILIGDSHAMQYIEVLKKIAREKRLNLYYINKKAEDFSIYSSSVEYSKIRKLKPLWIIISQYNHSNQNLFDFTIGIKSLRSLTKGLIYISDNPVYSDYLTYKHYVNPSLFSAIYSKEPSMQIKIDELSKDSFDTGLLFKSKVEMLDIVIVDPFDYLCQKGLCYRKFDDDYLYYDDHHLSLKGAYRFRPILRNLLIVSNQ